MKYHNCMYPVGADLLHADLWTDGQIDRQTERTTNRYDEAVSRFS